MLSASSFSPQIHERVLISFMGRSFRVQLLSLTWRGHSAQLSLAVVHLHAVGAGVSGWGRGLGTRRRRFLVVVVMGSSAVVVSIDSVLVPRNLA